MAATKAVKSAKGSKANPLTAGGEERARGDRWSHTDTNVGSSLLGRLVSTRTVTFADGKEGEALIFSPAMTLDEHGALEAHRQIETLYSASLAQKITPNTDKGVVFGIEYTGKEKSSKKGRTDFKTFMIVVQDASVLATMLRDADAPELAELLAIAE